MMKKIKFICIVTVIAILAMSGFFIYTPKTSADNWYDNNWSYRKKITIDHTKAPNTDQLDFPVLISLIDSDLQARSMNSGYDIFFTDSTGIAKLPYEREQYASETGTLVAWVKIANLSHIDDTVIYMYYGNAESSDQQDSAGGVWDSNFQSVWHSKDNGVATISDSTANASTGTKYGLAGPVETVGKIGNAQSYNGVDDYISVVSLQALSGSFTISVWAKVSEGDQCTDNASCTVIGTRSPDDASFDFKFDTGNIIHGDIGDGGDWITTSADVDPGNFSYSTDTWYQITYAVTPTGYKIYIDGNEVASGSYDEGAPLFFDSTHSIFIGQVGYGEEWFNGAIDEVRISNIARSADWIQTEYNNENNPSTFYSLSSEESIPVYTLTYTAGANGSITGTSPQTVNYNASGSEVSAVPATGYHFTAWSDDSTANPRTDANVIADISVTANFEIDTHTLTYTAGANGSITGTSPQTVNYNASGSEVSAVPATGYHFTAWSDDSTANPRTDANVIADISVTANFEIDTPSGGGGGGGGSFFAPVAPSPIPVLVIPEQSTKDLNVVPVSDVEPIKQIKQNNIPEPAAETFIKNPVQVKKILEKKIISEPIIEIKPQDTKTIVDNSKENKPRIIININSFVASLGVVWKNIFSFVLSFFHLGK